MKKLRSTEAIVQPVTYTFQFVHLGSNKTITETIEGAINIQGQLMSIIRFADDIRRK